MAKANSNSHLSLGVNKSTGTIGLEQRHGSPKEGVGSLWGLWPLVRVGLVPFVPLVEGIAVIEGIDGTDGIGIVGTDVTVEPCGNGDAEATAAKARAKTKVFIVRSADD
jgi:hypothetical protein